MATEGTLILSWQSSSSLTTGDSIIKCAIFNRLTTSYEVETNDFTTSNKVMSGVPISLIKSRHKVVALYRGMLDIHTTKRSSTKTRATSFRISMRVAKDLRSDQSIASLLPKYLNRCNPNFASKA